MRRIRNKFGKGTAGPIVRVSRQRGDARVDPSSEHAGSISRSCGKEFVVFASSLHHFIAPVQEELYHRPTTVVHTLVVNPTACFETTIIPREEFGVLVELKFRTGRDARASKCLKLFVPPRDARVATHDIAEHFRSTTERFAHRGDQDALLRRSRGAAPRLGRSRRCGGVGRRRLRRWRSAVGLDPTHEQLAPIAAWVEAFARGIRYDPLALFIVGEKFAGSLGGDVPSLT